MAGYAAFARIEQARPHRPAAERTTAAAQAHLAGASSLDDGQPDCVELIGTSLDERVGMWIAGVRESWSQTTFFLFDPESWR